MIPLARVLSLLTLLLVLAAAPVLAAELQGSSGPLAWRVGDVRQGPTTVDGVAHARHEFTLVVKNSTARTLALGNYSAQLSYVGIPMALESVTSLDARLAPGNEYRFQLYALLPCAEASTPCRLPVGPGWHIVVHGREGGGAPFSAPIDLALPAEPGRPVVAAPKLRITRVGAAVGPDATRVPARFTNNLVLVLVSAGGEELWMLLDTGAQFSILRPEAARRIGLVASADAPMFPASGFGGRVNAALVEWPPLRIGDYVIEHLIGGIAPLPEFPFAFDGVIGANFIEAARITLDYRARELRLEPAR